MSPTPSLTAEKLVPLTEVPDLLPRPTHGKKLSHKAIQRWARAGLSGVVLKSVYVGKSPYTSRQAIDRFLVRVTAAKNAKAAPQPTSAIDTPSHQAAVAELTRLGL